jgi:hypothetical protein
LRRLLKRVGLEGRLLGSYVVRGGWQGKVSPSLQLLFDPKARRDLLGAYAAALGLIWKQDAVAVSFLHPDGECLAIRISRIDGKPLTGTQMQRFYRLLYKHDAAKQATIGFTEYDGRMIFINLKGGLSDEEFERALKELAEEHLPDDVFLDFARADFELESTDWSVDHGEGYRQRLRKAGRPDLRDWAETVARPQAEQFLKTFDWKRGAGGQGRGRRKKES